jgi:uncharacterized protein YjiS (DUF1127 family)
MTMVFLRDISNDEAAPQWTTAEINRFPWGVGSVGEEWFRWLRTVLRHRHSRVVLSGLNDYLLRDIGMTRAEAEFEINKPATDRCLSLGW